MALQGCLSGNRKWLMQVMRFGYVSAFLFSCGPAEEPIEVVGPPTPSDLRVVAQADADTIFAGGSITLTASASGGTTPYIYSWDQNDGPVEVELIETQSTELEIGPLDTTGRYVFRIIVTDQADANAIDYVTVHVTNPVSAMVPRLAVVGELVQVQATLVEDADDVGLLWEVAEGTGTFDDPTAATTNLTTQLGETLSIRLTSSIDSGGAPVTSEQLFDVVSVVDLSPRVIIQTNFGDMVLELDGEAAPLHTANFLQYVDERFYDNLLFHRNACTPSADGESCTPFVLQGGGYERVDGELVRREPTQDPVESEADNGLTNATIYSVALALSSAGPDSGTSQFFINLDDNSSLDDQEFTVFGMIVEGQDVVDSIVGMPTSESPIIPGENSLPVEDVVIEHIIREGS